jgi:hypothetical protein
MIAAVPAFAASRPLSGVDSDMMARAMKVLARKRRHLLDAELFAIVDYSRPSRDTRFHIVRTDSGEVMDFHVSHGRGSDPEHTGYLESFSNEFGSLASSAGAYVTSELYRGKHGRSMRLKGLDFSNSNAEPRGIVIHAAAYAEPDMLARTGKLGRSEGCFAFSELDLFLVLRQLGPGRLIYADKG